MLDADRRYHEELKEVLSFTCGMVAARTRCKGILDDLNPADIINGIHQLYKVCEGWLAPFPWCEEFHVPLDRNFTRLKSSGEQTT